MARDGDRENKCIVAARRSGGARSDCVKKTRVDRGLVDSCMVILVVLCVLLKGCVC